MTDSIPTEGKFIIKDGKVVQVHDLLEWAAWWESEEGRKASRIGFTELPGYNISTVFLGLDYSFSERIPQLFETMVFEAKESEMEFPDGRKRKYHKSVDIDGLFERYATLEEAKAGHERIVEVVKSLKLS